jgi:hypothetical protein
MALRERLVYAIDVVTDGATKGLGNFTSAIKQADTPVSKFKAGTNAAFDSVKANAGTLALGAGAALATFGVKAVGAFTETAKAAKDMSSATGLSIEESSRWIAVADDFEISAEQMTAGLGKINKTLDDSKWSKYGIETRDAAGNAREANDILLDSLDALGKVSNETERARIGNELFGKGFANLAPLIGKTRGEYEEMLGAVGKGQVITAKEAESAEKARLAMDRLQDTIQELTINVGGKLAPAFEELTNNISDTVEMAEKLKLLDIGGGLAKIPTPLGLVNKGLDLFKDQLDHVSSSEELASTKAQDLIQSSIELAEVEQTRGEALDKIRGQQSEYIGQLREAGEAADEAAAAADRQAEADERVRQALVAAAEAIRDKQAAMLESLGVMHDYESAALNTADQVDSLNEAESAYNDVAADTEATATQKAAALRDVAEQQISSAEAALAQSEAYAAEMGAAEGSTAQALLQKQELERLAAKYPELVALIQGYIDKLNAIPAVKSTQLVVTSSGAITTKTTSNEEGRLIAGASGGIVNAPTMALIGESGPEAVIPLSKSPGNSALPAGLGGTTINLTVNATAGASGQLIGQQIVNEIKRWERQNGAGWRQ